MNAGLSSPPEQDEAVMVHPVWRLPSTGRILQCGALAVALLAGPTRLDALQARRAAFSAVYIVEVKDTATHLFHVSATFSNLPQPYLEVALPAWTPGAYSMANYGRNVQRFLVTDGSGSRRHAMRVQPQTWRIDTRGTDRVTVAFDYLATLLASNQAKITSEYAFFTGTQLFLEPLGHRDAPSTVRFVVPTGWRIVSALRETSDSALYSARNYDELVDAPTELGRFDVVRFDVDGKPHVFVATPAGAFSPSVLDAFVRMLPPIIRTQRAIFGSLPYDKYVFFYFQPSSEAPAPGGLEHGNSHVKIALNETLDERNLWLVAHEFFHLWNVKRIRPAEMWPYDYSQPNASPSLWLSEGVTSYYAQLTLYRAGIKDADLPSDWRADNDTTTLLNDLAFRITGIESGEGRRYESPSDASVAIWVDPMLGPNYYAQGQVLGALLDLSIRHETRGRRGFDDVMRGLFTDYYQRDRGFTPDDLVRVVSAAAGRDYVDFFRRHVTGIDVPPYDSIFGFAGYRLVRSTRRLAVIPGLVNAHRTDQGRHVNIVRPGSPAALAGIVRGDVILSVDGVPIGEVPLVNLYGQNWIGGAFVGRAGERVVLRVLRDGEERQLALILGTRDEVRVAIESTVAPTPDQLTVRSAWLRR